MRTSNFTPNSAGLGTVDGLLSTVNEGDTFAEVSASFSLTRNVFEFEDGGGGSLSVFSATISHMTSLNKESVIANKKNYKKYKKSRFNIKRNKDD